MNTERAADEPLVLIRDAVKTYGSTRALTGVTLDVNRGEVLGVVGHNGAGKSTLMRMLNGLETCDSGMIRIGSHDRPTPAGFPGVRMAYQEGSLAPELTIKENIYLSGRSSMPRWRWHGAAASRAVGRLQEIFPGNGLKASDYVDEISLAERQMVEIARATVTNDLKLLILDEPTESLSGKAVDNLYNYVCVLRSKGCSIVLISHRLREILGVCDRVAVMKDGAVVSTHRAADVTERDLLVAMGGEEAASHGTTPAEEASLNAEPIALKVPMSNVADVSTEIVARRGEVIGLAGIAGQGQEQVLARIWQARKSDVDVKGRSAYVPGDRQRSGIFPLWNVAGNLTISSIGKLSKSGIRQPIEETRLVERWVERLKVRGGAEAAITALSGGNQQKVIVARAFALDAEIILLDDPFRGVDVHTKIELYQLIRSEARRGKTVVWYSSENSEMQHCDRTYVLRAGRVAGELKGAEISDDRIIAMSFAEKGAGR